MKKFILKMSLFLVPFLILSINYIFYEKSGGDLNRIGKVSIEKDYRNLFTREFENKKYYLNLSEINLKTENKIDILTIGDSFSQQKNYGYQNYLASTFNLKIVNLERNYDNPLQQIFEMANGDTFDNLKVKYIIFQSVEREITIRGEKTDENKAITLEQLISKYNKNNNSKIVNESELGMGIFKDMALYFIYTVLYNFNERGYISQVYKMRINQKLFSTFKNELLFYHEDIKSIDKNNKNAVKNLNEKLNDLSEKLNNKGIKLIVLISPDKYDLYSPFILNNNLPKNKFFDYFNDQEKNYIYIDSKGILFNHINSGEKDIYFADDTHWSPISSKYIAKEIFEKIKK